MATFFNECFGIPEEALEEFGAFNVSLVNDLPLFIDPFLLFHSESVEYQQLHADMIQYVTFLRDRSLEASGNDDLLKAWYCFPEIKQNWLGFSVAGNSGSGLGIKFARALHSNLGRLFADFGKERITTGSHLEKVCLVSSGVGRDNISDFTTNLIIDYLCRYTERFAEVHVDPKFISTVHIRKARFNYATQTWRRAAYKLPVANGDFVILTPRDMLTRDENWINRGDLIRDFEQIPVAIPDAELRGQVFNYFQHVLPRPRDREPSQQERAAAVADTLLQFPLLILESPGFAQNFGSCGEVEGLHLVGVLTFGDEFREDVGLVGIQQKFRKALAWRGGDDKLGGRDARANGAQPGPEGVPDELGIRDREVVKQSMADDACLDEDVVCVELALDVVAVLGRGAVKMLVAIVAAQRLHVLHPEVIAERTDLAHSLLEGEL